MPTKDPQPVVFTPAQQVMRARLAALNPTQFLALKAILEQASSAIDVRLSQLESERAQLAAQKAKVVAVTAQLAKPTALDSIRAAISNGHVLTTKVTAVATKPGVAPKKPANPKKPVRPKKPGGPGG